MSRPVGVAHEREIGSSAGAVDAPLDVDPADRIEVRLLGPLVVRRADGSLIHPREWRTGKTVDLLRLLAARTGEAVSVDEILEALWPRVDEYRGRGSLRNALGQLRKLLGPTAVERRRDGLILRDAWVDTAALLRLADEARRHARLGRLALAVNVAREAEALHLGEFRAHDPDALWAVPIRENLEARFREMTVDAAEHAADLGWMRDALEFGQRALDADATSERAFRVLMRAYAGLGETERALREYERCRAVLAEELGLDPSPQTRALHLEILTADAHEPSAPPFTGRERELGTMLGWLAQRRATGTPGVVYLSGEDGSGRTRLVREAAQELGADLEVLETKDDARGAVVAAAARAQPGGSEVAERGGRQAILLVRPGGRFGSAERAELLRCLADARGSLTVVVRLSENATAALQRDAAGAGGASPETLPLHLLPLTPVELEHLATAQLGGPPSPQLLDALLSCSEGLPGRVLSTLDEWSHAGEIAATSHGLELVPPHDRSDDTGADHGALLARAMEQAGARDQQVLHLVALLDRPVSAGLLVPLMPEQQGDQGGDVDGPEAVRASLDRLVDLQLLVATPEGYLVRDPFLRQAVESWLRPSVRRRMHALIAEQARIPAAERGRHWRAAGEVELARAAAVDAAREAMAVGDVSAARVQLLVVTDLAERSQADSQDVAELEEALADVCLAAGRVDEAVQHYGRAAERLADPATPTATRLRDKAASAQRSLTGPGSLPEREVPTSPPPEPEPEPDDEALERAAWAAVGAADRSGTAADRVDARLLLVREHLLPSRRLARARDVSEEAMVVAGDGPSFLPAVSMYHLPDVLLGNAKAAERPLDAAWAAADREHPEAGHLAVLRCLLGHDLGRRDFDTRWEQAMALAPPDSEAVEWTWARVRILTERGSLAEAIEEDRRAVSPRATPLGRQLRALSTASLQAALGRGREAIRTLEEAMSEAEEEGCSLLLPEVTARMVVLTGPTDPDTAISLFELFDWAAGPEIGHPREGYLRLLARAAVRAGHHELDRAAAAAANAARIARESGLVLLASEAYLIQAQYLFEGGWSSGARVATASAARCLRAAGTVA